MAVTEGGKVWVLLARVRTVTWKLAARIAFRMAGPRLPVAWGERLGLVYEWVEQGGGGGVRW